MIFPDYSLYLCTDKELMSSATLEESVTDAILGGVTCVQLREKNCSSLQFYNEAKTIQEITQAHHVPLIINDRLDIALTVNADGLHVGQDDLPAHKARELLGPNKILGVSVRTSKEAIAAEKAGADYLGVGAMFSTSTKTDAQIVSKEELLRIRESVNIPLILIGGMNKQTIPEFLNYDIQGFAVVSAIISAPNVKLAAQELKSLIDHK
jgi:thiamine-phosphate pyrophosphorylase